MELFRYIMKYVRHIRTRLLIGGLLLIVSMALSIMNPLIIGKYIDMPSAGADVHHIIAFVLLLTASWGIGTIISYVSSINSTHMQIRLMYSINFHLLQHVERFPYATLEQTDTVYLNNRIHNDSSVLASFFLDSFLGAIVQAGTCLISMGIIFSTAPFIGLFTVLLLPVYMMTYVYFKSRIEKCSEDLIETRDVFFGEMQKQLRHVRTIKLNSWYERLFSSLIKRFDPVYNAAIHSAHINSRYSFFAQMIQIVANVTIFLFCGIAVCQGAMELGSLIIINALFATLFSAFSSLMNFGKAYANASAAFNRVNELELTKEEDVGELAPNRISEIQIRDLTFSYPSDDRIVLNHISLKFTAGTIYQIKGENGCGKSTLLCLLLGLYESTGKIYFDKTPIDLLDMFLLRQKNISIVEQEPPLIFGNIFENITDGCMDDFELSQRMQQPDLKAFVGGSSLLTDRRLFDGASSLSGGEKQKVAILRALLKDPQVLILDEPTSALDLRSCEQLKKILKRLKQDRIIILVDHQSVFSDIVDVSYNLHMGTISPTAGGPAYLCHVR